MIRPPSLWLCCVITSSFGANALATTPPVTSPGHPPASPPAEAGSPGELYEAALSAKLASERLHRYRFVEYPRIVRRLDDAIRLAEAEVAVLAARARSYRPFRSFRQYSVAYTAAQDVQLRLLAATQRLRDLREQRAELGSYRRATIRALEIDRAAAIRRMLALRPAEPDVPTSDAAASGG